MPAAIPAIAAVAGSVIGAAGSKSAARTQAASADRATEAQREAMGRQIQLQEPWRQAGGLGLNALAYGLGLSPTGTFTPGATGGGAGGSASAGGGIETPEQIRERLTAQYITSASAQNPLPEPEGGWGIMGQQYGPMTTERRIDEAALGAAVRAETAKQQAALAAQNRTATTAASKDPNYGNLLRDFGMSDFEADPGYQFRSDEGLKALERSAAARGGLLSGRAMKDTMRFSQGLASQEYGAAFDRFNVNKTNKFNRLASISGLGQTAANQTGAAVGAFGQASANNLIGAGNARAAGTVGMANALTQGLSSYQSQNMLAQNRGGPSFGGRIDPDAYGFDGSNGAYWN